MEKQPVIRIESIDLLRGLVMMLMLLDHSRDFLHYESITLEINPLDPEKSNVALYLTRWVTHLCAPIFVSLAGLSIFLQKEKADPNKPFSLTWFLITRGFWLVFLEITVIGFGWTFLPPFQISYLQVIWTIGISMVFMGILSHLNSYLVLIAGLFIVGFHNFLDPLDQQLSNQTGGLWNLIHNCGTLSIIRIWNLFIVYPFLPWLGIMMIGFGAGPLFTASFKSEKRRKILLYCGISFLVFFFLFRWMNVFGDPNPTEAITGTREFWYQFFNVEKYPPSLLYSLATLGIGCLLLRQFENLKSALNTILLTFGRVPMFFYILHLFSIHALAILLFLITGGKWKETDFRHGFGGLPDGFGFSLGWVYVFSIALLCVIYWPCRWFESQKRKNKGAWWISYL